jgi:hypothetical protein
LPYLRACSNPYVVIIFVFNDLRWEEFVRSRKPDQWVQKGQHKNLKEWKLEGIVPDQFLLLLIRKMGTACQKREN